MSRSPRYANFVRVAALAMFIAAGVAGAAVIFVDDFTDPVASHLRWLKSLPDDMLSATVDGGSLTLTNNSAYVGDYYGSLGNSKPSVLTVSVVLKSISADGHAGVMFCRGDGPEGYLLTVYEGEVGVFKFTKTSNGGVSYSSIRLESSFDLNHSSDTLMASKNGSTINVFVNGVFQFSISDTQFASGDVSLYVSPQANAVFGPVRVTDEFIEGGQSTEFSDNFSSSELRYWQYPNSTVPVANVVDGRLVVNPGAGSATWIYVDLNITDFSVKVDVNHVSGTTGEPYGIVLVGERTGGALSMVNFAIRGDRRYTIWDSNDNEYISVPSTAIKGSAGDLGVVFIDTLEVRKMPGSNQYDFLANGTLLASYPVVNFKIASIGLFCYSAQTVSFDNFAAKKEVDPSSIKHGVTKISRRPAGAKRPASTVFYDLRGRKRYTVAASPAAGRMPVRAAGMYVTENGREIRIRKGAR